MPLERLAIVEWLWRSLKVTETPAARPASYHILPASGLHLPASPSCADSEELLLSPGKFCNLHQFYVYAYEYTCGSTVMSKITSHARVPSSCRPKDIYVGLLPNVTESLKVFSRPIWAIRCSQMALPISITVSLLLANSYYVLVVYRFRIIVNISIVMVSRDSGCNPSVESLLCSSSRQLDTVNLRTNVDHVQCSLSHRGSW